MINFLKGKLFNVKYVVIQSVQFGDRAAFSLVTVDPSHTSKRTVKCKRTGKEYYKNDIYCRIFTFKSLLHWARLLHRKKDKFAYYTVLVLKGKVWHSLEEQA